MINSFWNLCRICPSMPTEKLNSEYKTHFKWHESYHAPIQEAVKKSADVREDGERLRSPVNEEMTRSLEEQIIATKDDFVPERDYPLHDDNIPSGSTKPKKFKTEYKSRFKAPMKYIYVEGAWKKGKMQTADTPSKPGDELPVSWYGEVLELRKKAGEYKVRSWASAMAPDHLAEMYTRQKDVWDQVSRRSSLSALALAATPSPVRTPKPEVDTGRGRIPTRHHLERTTPSDGSLLTSPTRDHKLEPQIQKEKETKAYPAKTKPSYKSSPGLVSGRSASVGPEGRSPKHIPRTASASTSRTHVGEAHADDSVKHTTTKRPRPTSLATSTSRPKSAAKPHDVTDGDGLAKPHSAARVKSSGPSRGVAATTAKEVSKRSEKEFAKERVKEREVEKKLEKEIMVNGNDSDFSKDLPSPESLPPKITDYVPAVKSPPEPTRVKSPEQIIVKSPEPVKWTVPLETGIKWTGTLQIDGDTLGKFGKDDAKVSPSTQPTTLPIEHVEDSSDQSPPPLCQPALVQEHPPPTISASTSRVMAEQVLGKARSRFDSFWGKMD